MDLLPHLWLPILLSSIAAWFASAIIWMALPHHKKDHLPLPNEQGFMDSLRAQNIPAGNYAFPHFGEYKKCNTPEAKKLMEEGPLGLISIWGKVSMGRNMALTFLVFLVASALLGYLGAITLPRGASFGRVMQVMGTAGILTYTVSSIPNSIWFGAYTRTIIACIFDGIVYGLITAAIFAAMWPGLT